MNLIAHCGVSKYSLYEHDDEQRWLPDKDIMHHGVDRAWDDWSPETEVQRLRFLAKCEKAVSALEGGDAREAIGVIIRDDLLLPLKGGRD